MDLDGNFADVPERELIQSMRLVYPFKLFEIEIIRRISRTGVPIQYQPGETIVFQDDEGDSMFIIIRGTVELYTELDHYADSKAQQFQHKFLFSGQTFGENSLVWHEERDGNMWKSFGRREWTAIADTFCVVLELTRKSMKPVSCIFLSKESRTLHVTDFLVSSST